MIHQRLRIYDERTGDPAVDNRNRRRNRLLHCTLRNSFRVQTPRGRRRKKIITRVEYEQYARVIAEIAEVMAASLALPTEPIVAVAERAKQRRPERRPIVTTMPL